MNQRDKIRDVLRGITVKIKYKSVFNECTSTNLNYKLEWFGRDKNSL